MLWKSRRRFNKVIIDIMIDRNTFSRGIIMKKKLLAILMGTSLVLVGCGGNNDSADNKTTAGAGSAETLYQNSCSACHGGDLTGGVGPNLTKVGTRLSQQDIEKIINEGKGTMPSKLIDESQAAQVAKWLASKK